MIRKVTLEIEIPRKEGEDKIKTKETNKSLTSPLYGGLEIEHKKRLVTPPNIFLELNFSTIILNNELNERRQRQLEQWTSKDIDETI